MIENLILFALSLNKESYLDDVKKQIDNLDLVQNRIVDFIPINDSYFNTIKINKDVIDVENNFRSGIVFDNKTGEIYWSKNINDKRSIASLTKIMTILVFLDTNTNLYDYVTVTKDDLAVEDKEAAKIGFYVGDKVMVKDLLYAGYIGSKNDAINLLVKSTGLSQEEFVKKMNDKAKELGLKDTVFTNVNGLDVTNISTAKDLGKLVYYAFANKTIQNLSQVKEYTFKTKLGKTYKVTNTDKLLNTNNFDIIAAKTGYLDESLYCLALLSKKGNRELISVLLGNDTDEQRFYDAEALNLFIFKNWR